ncbi:hypothetical protein DFH28DRAFT_887012, partial [Melampsora americana]
GKHEKERIMLAIQLCTRTLKKHLTTYNCLAQEFHQMYPDHPTSPVIESKRWATHKHNQMWHILDTFIHNPIANNPIDLIENFLENSVLKSLSTDSKIGVVEGMLHNAFVKISGFQKQWDIQVMELLQRTLAQVGDSKLMTLWKSQLLKVCQLCSSGCGLTKAGSFGHLFSPHNGLQGAQVAGGTEVDDDADSLSDVDAEAWERNIDQGMIFNIINAVDEE